MKEFAILRELARQVRGHTIRLLDAAHPEWLTWAPEGTSNHVLWHAGHAVWLQDALCIEPLTDTSELRAGWADLFGMQCRPVAQTTSWPNRNVVKNALQQQLDLILILLGEAGEHPRRAQALERLARSEMEAGVIHSFHDEARHQGEMYLLMKMCRGGVV